MPKFRGCAIFWTGVIRQRLPLKFIGFSMKTRCWCTFVVHQHGSRKPVKTSGFCLGSLKTFLVSPKLENIRIDTSLNILVIQNSKTQGESVFSSTWHVSQKQSRYHAVWKKSEIQTAIFRNKACYRAENRPADISLRCLLPDIGKNSEFLILPFSNVTCNPRIVCDDLGQKSKISSAPNLPSLCKRCGFCVKSSARYSSIAILSLF